LLAEQSGYFAATMLELSTVGVLPWDHADTAVAFRKRLQALVEKAGDALDLAPSFAAVQRLEAVGQRVREVQGTMADTAPPLNRAIRRASQELLNVYFTVGGRYHQDPATTFPLLPGLRDLPKLARLRLGTEE